MDRKTVIHASQTLGHKAACGIGIIGDLLAKALAKSTKYNFRILYTDGLDSIESAITDDVVAIIYHHSVGSTPWVNNPHLRNKYPNIKHIKTHHDMTQNLASIGAPLAFSTAYLKQIDTFTPEDHHGFNYVIADDPTLTGNEHVFTTQRIIPSYVPKTSCTSEVPIIGFSGFAAPHKGIHRIAQKVQEEFDEAVINLHIPFGFYGDPHGTQARRAVQDVRRAIRKPGISVVASHDLLSVPDVVDLLAQNTINCYFYDFLAGCGLASSPDFALAARRPIAVTKSHQFRHLWNLEPSILIEENSLKEIIENGITPLEPLYQAYTEENVVADYERILDHLLSTTG